MRPPLQLFCLCDVSPLVLYMLWTAALPRELLTPQMIVFTLCCWQYSVVCLYRRLVKRPTVLMWSMCCTNYECCFIVLLIFFI